MDDKKLLETLTRVRVFLGKMDLLLVEIIEDLEEIKERDSSG